MKTDKIAPYFSVIVPCCNIENCIDRMGKSLLEQTFRDFEVLLMVEDSTDRTLELCEALSAQDSRFYVSLQNCSGSPSSPRNNGLDRARGKYAVFLDGDDLLLPMTLEILYNGALRNHEPDVIQIAAEELLDDGQGNFKFLQKLFNYSAEDHDKVYSGPGSIVRIGKLHTCPKPMVWLGICRIAFLNEHSLRQYPGLIYEGEEWTARVLFLAERVLVLDRVLYRYCRKVYSIVNSGRDRDLRAIAVIMRSLFAFCASHTIPDDVYEVWQEYWLSNLFFWFFYPQETISNIVRLRALKILLAGEGKEYFHAFLKRSGFLRYLAWPFILLTRPARTPAWVIPACCYFRLIYYPLRRLQGKKPDIRSSAKANPI